MSKPLLEGNNARYIGKNQYDAAREIAAVLIGALQNSKHRNFEAVERAIIEALTINESRAKIDYLMSQGKHQEALSEILAKHELPEGKTG